MQGKTHLLIGAAAGAAMMGSYPIERGLLLVGAAVFGSIIPDLDHPRSTINQTLLPVKNKMVKIMIYMLIGCIFLSLSSAYNNHAYLVFGVAFILTGFSHHRGFTHSILGLTMFTWAVHLFMTRYNLVEVTEGFFIGYLSHLIGDFITKEGIKIFYPIKSNFRSPITIKSGGKSEQIIVIIASFALIYFIF